MSHHFEAQGISVIYDKGTKPVVGLDKVSLEFDPTEITCIIGPSGSGKSTLIKALIGIVPLRTGLVHLEEDLLSSSDDHHYGHNFSNSRKRARSRVAWIAQDYCLSNNSTVLSNVCSGALYKRSAFDTLVRGFSQVIKDKAFNYLIDLGLEEKVHEKVRRLSGGQKQRVAIARSYVQNSWWILGDEPFSALDEGCKKQVLSSVRERHQEGRGLILVVHDVNQALGLAHRVIALKNGRIVFDGKPDKWTDQHWQDVFGSQNNMLPSARQA